ncbi:hypothetical protein BDW02DRAFT_494573 [Decorospora gaudefroyi]|uniref:Altered inheritance of mitochondria protein 5, mitochondrial n=1 Tax=Decorospora gaudefroyi TaxID=184978 RepID=A0A6A5KQS1_9PLEO|nr:hypothetical protein BDW02DRAFT_494573 [Decorospora gaudefroyi]
MAGRIIPFGLATIASISTVVATFGGEFKQQRLARTEEENKQELATAAASSASNASPVVSNATTSIPEPLPATGKTEGAVASGPVENSWLNTLGLWAWKKDTKEQGGLATKKVEEVKGRP